MSAEMRVVRASVVFLTLAIPQIDSEHSRQRSILGYPAHHVAVAVLEALDDVPAIYLSQIYQLQAGSSPIGSDIPLHRPLQNQFPYPRWYTCFGFRV